MESPSADMLQLLWGVIVLPIYFFARWLYGRFSDLKAESERNKQKLVIETVVNDLLAPHIARISSLESDMKSSAISSLEMSSSIKADINKVLHRLDGDIK